MNNCIDIRVTLRGR